MSSQPKTYLTPSEYLELERRAEFKSEYYNGEMFAIAGASLPHGRIVANIGQDLGNQLEGGPCEVYTTDIRLRVSPSGMFTYPDVMVVCGAAQVADDQKDTLLNPTLIIEVLSESTRGYDRGRKFQHYRTLPSLAEYLTVEQDAPHIERHTRQPEGGWLLEEFDGLSQTVRLPSIGCILELDRVYRGIDW
jgi:Uma2 family endonuclease